MNTTAAFYQSKNDDDNDDVPNFKDGHIMCLALHKDFRGSTNSSGQQFYTQASQLILLYQSFYRSQNKQG